MEGAGKNGIEASFVALVAAWGGGAAAAAARAAAEGKSALISSPIPFKLTNCDPEAAIQMAEVVVTDPIPIGSAATVSAHGTVSRAVVAPVQTSITLEKEFYGRWLPVPCLTVLGRRVGSCNYVDVCAEFKPRTSCPPPLGPAGIPCACPVAAGAYTLPPTVISTVVPKELPKELGNGNYRVSVVMKDAVGSVACYNVQFSTVGI